MENSKVSIIIPIYNVEVYLDYCMQSVFSQNYSNLEIILVDDGSTDSSGRLCDLYAEKDERVIVIHKKNGGLSSARNAALKISSGDYISFVDSDDYIRFDYISYMVECIKRDRTDLVVCSYRRVFENTDFCSRDSHISNHEVIDREALMLNMASRKVPMFAPGKLYRANKFAQLTFPEGRLYEDMPTIWEVAKKVDRVTILSDELYFYRQRPNSIVNAGYNHGRMDQVYFSEQIYADVEAESELGYAAASRCFFASADNYSLVTKDYPDDEKYLYDAIKKYRKFPLKDSHSGTDLKLMSVISYISIRLVRVVGKLYKQNKYRKYVKTHRS